MNKLSVLVYPLVALMSLAAAVAAHAEGPLLDNPANPVWTQSKTRAQVQAELVQARAEGSVTVGSTEYSPVALVQPLRSIKSRAEVRSEVRSELRTARAADYSATWFGEDSGSFELARLKPSREAGPVLAGTPKSAN